MIIIGLTGPAGCGKSTLAAYLVANYRFVEFAFADPLRDMLAALLRINRPALDKMLLDREWKESPISTLGTSPRRILQTLGTEWGRMLIHPDLWISLLDERLDAQYRGHYAGVVISDVRFDNEAKYVRERGLLLHIARPDLTSIDKHESEAGVQMHHRDQMVMNTSLELLYRQADNRVCELRDGAAA